MSGTMIAVMLRIRKTTAMIRGTVENLFGASSPIRSITAKQTAAVT